MQKSDLMFYENSWQEKKVWQRWTWEICKVFSGLYILIYALVADDLRKSDVRVLSKFQAQLAFSTC